MKEIKARAISVGILSHLHFALDCSAFAVISVFKLTVEVFNGDYSDRHWLGGDELENVCIIGLYDMRLFLNNSASFIRLQVGIRRPLSFRSRVQMAPSMDSTSTFPSVLLSLVKKAPMLEPLASLGPPISLC